MAINPNDFIPRPGFVNKQGHLPDPVELCCIQVPKIFDQCLIKKCLKPVDDPTQLCKQVKGITDPTKVKKIGCCRDFDVKINSISKTCLKGQDGYKRVTINFTVPFSIDVDVEKTPGTITTETINYSVTKTITIPKFYVPDPIAEISLSEDEAVPGQDADKKIIKLEVVADCLNMELSTIKCDSDPEQVFLCVTLGLFIIVKSELVVQLLIPCYGYCPTPKECSCVEDPCKEFMSRIVPKFYPPQKMDNLFPDYIDDKDN